VLYFDTAYIAGLIFLILETTNCFELRHRRLEVKFRAANFHYFISQSKRAKRVEIMRDRSQFMVVTGAGQVELDIAKYKWRLGRE
jgi:hypothetical protein